MGDVDKEKFAVLRDEVLNTLASMNSALLDSDQVDYTLMLHLTQVTGDSEVARSAYEKILKITDEVERSAALMELLDLVELNLANEISGDEYDHGDQESVDASIQAEGESITGN